MEGKVVWFTGLSGAGKTTLCQYVADQLQTRGLTVRVVDGDNLRKGLCEDLGFSPEDRAENVRRAMHLAMTLAMGADFVLVALITPFQLLRDMVREHIPDLAEVFVDAPLPVCERRDSKGLYRKARAGVITNFTGVDSPFETPQKPDLVCRTDQESIEICVASVLSHLNIKTHTVPGEHVRRRTIAVDFDGVIADYNGWRGKEHFGPVRPDVLTALRQLRAKGWKIVVHTTRGAEDVRSYLVSEGVPFDELNCNSDYTNVGCKPVATVYWDDRALTYSGDASRDLKLICDFRTWNDRD